MLASASSDLAHPPEAWAEGLPAPARDLVDTLLGVRSRLGALGIRLEFLALPGEDAAPPPRRPPPAPVRSWAIVPGGVHQGGIAPAWAAAARLAPALVVPIRLAGGAATWAPRAEVAHAGLTAPKDLAHGVVGASPRWRWSRRHGVALTSAGRAADAVLRGALGGAYEWGNPEQPIIVRCEFPLP